MQKIKNESKSVPVTTDFGVRKVLSQNFSRLVALPKTALSNCGFDETSRVSVVLVQENQEKYIKLTPTKKGLEEVIKK